MSTQSSSDVSSLHQQKVKWRKIIVTEDPRLHLIWKYDRMFIRPLPRYLLSYTFWSEHMSNEKSTIWGSNISFCLGASTWENRISYLTFNAMSSEQRARISWQRHANSSSLLIDAKPLRFISKDVPVNLKKWKKERRSTNNESGKGSGHSDHKYHIPPCNALSFFFL